LVKFIITYLVSQQALLIRTGIKIRPAKDHKSVEHVAVLSALGLFVVAARLDAVLVL
jgi:hypothetical protein